MSEDTKLTELIINTLSPEQFAPITPSETEIYLVEDDAEYATVEELATKQDVITDLGDIRNNIATNTSNISYLDEKVRDIELFKFPNAVIIGEPTISNGQVSGFSANNYMQFPFILDLHNTPFQIDFAFTTGQDVTTQQNILDSEFGLALAIANGKGLMAISGNGTSWNIGSSVGTIAIQPNTTYYARLTWDGMQYKTLISTNGTDYTQDMYLVGTQRPYPRTIFIGGCSGSAIGHSPHPFFGTINMNKAYLSTRGQVIWQGMDDAGLATRADISLSNLDELGEKRFTDKQDVITDLATIRDGASKGATALQSIPIAKANVVGGVAGGNWLTVNQTTGKMECGELTKAQYDSALGYTFISKTTLENRLANKQDKLVSGTNIKTINGEDVLGSGDIEIKSGYHPDIFSTKWSDHLINDIQWLRADTFSWQSGDVYVTAYNTLVQEYATGVEETEGSITFKRSANGFKIAIADMENAILSKYNTDGIAWYYILDTTNKRFKLPRTKFGFEGVRDNVGEDIAESLPNITGSLGQSAGRSFLNGTGALKSGGGKGNNKGLTGTTDTEDISFSFDASLSSSTYQDNAPVQERATQMYLYFYVGEYSREAIEQTAGLNTDLFNGKLDLNASNLSTQGREYISGLGMPSSRFTDLTLGASGSTYIAPANGYFYASASVNNVTNYIGLMAKTSGNEDYYGNFTSRQGANWGLIWCTCPVKTGQVVVLGYEGGTPSLKFIYAEGEQ